MILYQIRVHPLSAKILISEFGIEKNKIHIPKTDVHNTIMTSNLCRTSNLLSVTIEVHTHLKSISKYVGGNLYHYHKRKIFEYILTNLDMNVTAADAIRNFYTIYEIDDDDYDSDNIYREWIRYYSIIKNKTSSYVIRQEMKEAKIINPDALTANEIASRVVSKYLHIFYNKNGTFNLSFLHQIVVYLTVKVDKKKPKLSTSVVYDRLKRCEYLFGQYPEIKAIIDEYIARNG